MEREPVADRMAVQVVGGSIVFTQDHTMCGLNCNNQCIVNDYDKVIDFIDENKNTMKEAAMMRAMIASGLLTLVK